MDLYINLIGIVLGVFAILVGLKSRSGMDKLLFGGGVVVVILAGYGLVSMMGGR